MSKAWMSETHAENAADVIGKAKIILTEQRTRSPWMYRN